jgi:hypothetical protein
MPMIQLHKSQPQIKTPARFHFTHTAHAPQYGSILLYTQQQTEDIAAFEHFT